MVFSVYDKFLDTFPPFSIPLEIRGENMSHEFFFTVFTPIYNRKDTIHRVWESLCNQTYKDFEWLIINDGSTDDVLPLLEEYKEKADFPVRIYSQQNKGKHIAFNVAIEAAKGYLMVPADSDDAFVPETLETFKLNWDNLTKSRQQYFSGINCLCLNAETKQIVGDKYPESPLVTDHFELVYKHKLKGEKWGCIRTDVLRQFSFPDEFKSSYYPESFLWFQISRQYKSLSINEPLRYYFVNTENSVLKSAPGDFNKKGNLSRHFMLWDYNTNLDMKLKYKAFKDILRLSVKIWVFSMRLNKSLKETFKSLKPLQKFISLLTLIPSAAFYKIKYRN